MNDPACVRLDHRVARFEDVLDRLLDRQRPALREHAMQIGAVEVLHHKEGQTAFTGEHLALVDHAHDVLRLQLQRRARLTKEARELCGVRFGCRRQQLDRDAVSEDGVTRAEHDAHPAPTEHLFDPIFPGQNLADAGHRHGVRRRLLVGALFCWAIGLFHAS